MGSPNVMRWDCDKGGPGANCFNVKKRVKLGEFAECFPGNIAMGDVDGIVEIGGRVLLLEWKGFGIPITTGQRIMYERISSRDGFLIACVERDAETMEVRSVSWWHNGKLGGAIKTDINGLRGYFRDWASWCRDR